MNGLKSCQRFVEGVIRIAPLLTAGLLHYAQIPAAVASDPGDRVTCLFEGMRVWAGPAIALFVALISVPPAPAFLLADGQDGRISVHARIILIPAARRLATSPCR